MTGADINIINYAIIERRIVLIEHIKEKIARSAGRPANDGHAVQWAERPGAPPYPVMLDAGVNFQTGRQQYTWVVKVGADWLRRERPQWFAELLACRLAGHGDPLA